MQTYTVRNKEGVMIMRLVGHPADRLLAGAKDVGSWRTYQEKSGKRTVCFELSQDMKWGLENHHGAFEIFLWEGTKIIKD